MNGKKLHFGIIGAGRIGRVHAETLAFRLPEAEILTIADVKGEAAQALAARCNIPNVVASADAIFADPRIEAVLICTPTDTHADLIVQAAQAGKHIFCEKPVALSLKKIDSSLAAAEAAGVQLQVGFNRRFDSNFVRVRKAVATGEIGTPNLIHIISRDPAPPPISYLKPSGGIFLDMMIHDFDMARYLIGDEVEEVYTAGGVMVDPAFKARAIWTPRWLCSTSEAAPSAPSTTAARRLSGTISALRYWAARARSPRKIAIRTRSSSAAKNPCTPICL